MSRDTASEISIWRVLFKATALFILFNLLFAWFQPLPQLGKLSLYNWLVPGRERLPFGENPNEAYNFSLNNLNAMFASHKLADGYKPDNEFRVVLIGDSATWGYYLENHETVSSLLDQAGLQTPSGRQVRFYNLGYPTISLTKDLMLIQRSLDFEPDLLIWLLTLESFPKEKQVFTPLVQNNPSEVLPILEQFNIQLQDQYKHFTQPNFWEGSLIGQRRALADLLRLQLYGPAWAATSIDHYIPENYALRAEDLEADESYYGISPQDSLLEVLSFDVLDAGIQLAGDTPVLIINEPIFVSQGENSHLRYNFFYPRWVYDGYRQSLLAHAESQQWHYFDLWRAVPDDEFTNSAIHFSPKGAQIFSDTLLPMLKELIYSLD